MADREDLFFVVVAPGFEPLVAEELNALGISPSRILKGGVEVTGGLRELYLANLWLRTASRVLVRLGEVTARDFPTLFQRLSRLPWGRFLKPGYGCEIRVAAHNSRLNHSGRIAETCRAAISKALGQTTHAAKAGQKIYLRMDQNRCQVSIDSSGQHLHQRGYRKAIGSAPLRETLAAGCLLALGYDGSMPLCDPMTGSGTFAAEAALIALNRAPGREREFSFMQWPKYRQGLWQQLQLEAQRDELAELPHEILAVDNNPKAVAAALTNFAALGLERSIQLLQADMQQVDSLPQERGVLICNPPYGERLGKNATLEALYRDIGQFYLNAHGWRRALVCPQSPLLKQCRLPFSTDLEFSNGGIPVVLMTLAESV